VRACVLASLVRLLFETYVPTYIATPSPNIHCICYSMYMYVQGICSTGFIITAAGLIMAVAFGGLFTSSELILNQTAFLLVFAVLLDTFVVRTLCVPALLGLTDSFSWRPGTMTPATKTIGF
jgi:hypothetical protein